MPQQAEPWTAATGESGRTGAFVARMWLDEQGLRARVRHTLDLDGPEEVVTFSGAPGDVVPDLIGRFRHWVEDFAGHTDEPPVGHGGH